MKKSISYWSFSGKNVFEAMRLAKDAGFDGIELTLDAEGDVTMETAPEKLAEIRRAAEEIGIALPSVASSLYWAYSFTSDDPEEREKAHQAAVCEIKTAKALGADTVLIVPGRDIPICCRQTECIPKSQGIPKKWYFPAGLFWKAVRMIYSGLATG